MNRSSVDLISQIPDIPLDVLLGYLHVKDLVHLSLTCSKLNAHVYSYLKNACLPSKLNTLIDIYSPLIDIMENYKEDLDQDDMNLLLKLRKCLQFYTISKTDAKTSKVDMYQMYFSKISFEKHIEIVFSGKWDAEYDQNGKMHSFEMVLLFDKVENVVKGFSKDVKRQDLPELDFATIDGKYNFTKSAFGWHGSIIQFEKKYRGDATHAVDYEGYLEELEDCYVVKGVYFGTETFQMTKMKRILCDSSKVMFCCF